MNRGIAAHAYNFDFHARRKSVRPIYRARGRHIAPDCGILNAMTARRFLNARRASAYADIWR